MNGLRVQCEYGPISRTGPVEWTARAYRGDDYVAIGSGATELEAFADLLRFLHTVGEVSERSAAKLILEEACDG